ncbi:formate dehydrogenase subunit delta [Methylomonas rapida]|jgi:NADH-dependant formate dehydrogenase delta subunit FdsD.|uniref:Formate dehydrogenase subunit delta n=1 Tax=Methylomonas rapida TaxID=2963939 RepID=A0ABY7GI43_9GAMM|nr:formate dehydrogenase subunit delta [Methylomonas rapida]WAR43916.1 formate dehydrogenase subunit delta [Methylomonas rapida]
MDNSNLIKMANNIGAFFKSEPDRDLAIQGVEQHIRNFWEPRMRKQIVEYVDNGGSDLLDIVTEAVKKLAKS